MQFHVFKLDHTVAKGMTNLVPGVAMLRQAKLLVLGLSIKCPLLMKLVINLRLVSKMMLRSNVIKYFGLGEVNVEMDSIRVIVLASTATSESF